ncbi:hypothetical protein FRC17_002495 [Serendipita sp. 399]|nr:hypothetical protein FRC17_002495 [Serendipita sp. 399]
MPSLGYHAYKSKAKYEIWQKWQKHPLNVELKIIRGRVANECMANLFAETVRRLVEKSSAFKSTEKSVSIHNDKRVYNRKTDGSPRPSTEPDPIKDIVLRVKDQIFVLDDDDDESYLRCGEILLDGMKDLKVLMAHKRSPKKLAKLEEEESEAIWQDQRRYESILCQSAPLPSSNPNTPIRIFFMEDPNKEPYLLKQDRLMTTYNDIIWYLNIHKIVQAPELWVRREDPNVQPYTSSGRHWVFVSGVESINETVLDTVEMTSVSDSYIVALVDNGEQEKPVPIGQYSLRYRHISVEYRPYSC